MIQWKKSETGGCNSVFPHRKMTLRVFIRYPTQRVLICRCPRVQSQWSGGLKVGIRPFLSAFVNHLESLEHNINNWALWISLRRDTYSMLPTLLRQVPNTTYAVLVALLGSSTVPGNPQVVRLEWMLRRRLAGFTLWAAVAPVVSLGLLTAELCWPNLGCGDQPPCMWISRYAERTL